MKIAFHILFMFTATPFSKKRAPGKKQSEVQFFYLFPFGLKLHRMVCLLSNRWRERQLQYTKQASVCFTDLSASFLVAQPSFLGGPLQLPFCPAWWSLTRNELTDSYGFLSQQNGPFLSVLSKLLYLHSFVTLKGTHTMQHINQEIYSIHSWILIYGRTPISALFWACLKAVQEVRSTGASRKGSKQRSDMLPRSECFCGKATSSSCEYSCCCENNQCNCVMLLNYLWIIQKCQCTTWDCIIYLLCFIPMSSASK